jgi:hypothetical protein
MEIVGFVGIRSSLGLIELSKLISGNIAAEIEFGGLDEHLKEEVPAVYSLKEFLGLRLVLFGEDGEYGISIEQWDDELLDDERADLSNHLYYLLKKIDGIDVVQA